MVETLHRDAPERGYTLAMRLVEGKTGFPLATFISMLLAGGMGQRAIAGQLGISGATLSRWLRRLGMRDIKD